MSRNVVMSVLVVLVLTLGATAQEQRSEIGLQGTGFFTKDSNGQGISQHATDTGGLLVSYRYWFNRWIATQADYGYNRITQQYFIPLAASRVQADIHQVTGGLVVSLPHPTLPELTPRREAYSFTEAVPTFHSANTSPCGPSTVASSITRRTSDSKA